jgi:hypothetical protein
LQHLYSRENTYHDLTKQRSMCLRCSHDKFETAMLPKSFSFLLLLCFDR